MVYKISLNQFVAFKNGSDSKKRRIIRQQKNPDKFRIAWYQLVKARLRKALGNQCDLQFVEEGLEILKTRIPKNKRQETDRMVSIEAMKKFLGFKLPKILKEVPHEVIKVQDLKSIFINGVEVIVSPDVIYRFEINDQTYLGGVKIHISKNDCFDIKQCKYMSTLIFEYLNQVVRKSDEVVLADACIAIDVFGGQLVSGPTNYLDSIQDIKLVCEEIKSIWKVA